MKLIFFLRFFYKVIILLSTMKTDFYIRLIIPGRQPLLTTGRYGWTDLQHRDHSCRYMREGSTRTARFSRILLLEKGIQKDDTNLYSSTIVLNRTHLPKGENKVLIWGFQPFKPWFFGWIPDWIGCILQSGLDPGKNYNPFVSETKSVFLHHIVKKRTLRSIMPKIALKPPEIGIENYSARFLTLTHFSVIGGDGL